MHIYKYIYYAKHFQNRIHIKLYTYVIKYTYTPIFSVIENYIQLQKYRRQSHHIGYKPDILLG